MGALLYFLFRLKFAIYDFSHQILQRGVLIHGKMIGKVYQTSNEKVPCVHQTMHQNWQISNLDCEIIKLFDILHMYCMDIVWKKLSHLHLK